ncbi:MAG: hypothetical protein QOI06_2878 [Nocardioidaceae bacterium]|jgi:hypothetical protein|nr:hypothetical protein [Nocardioidaceae bacterium]
MAVALIGKTHDRVLIGDLDSTHQADLVDAWRQEGINASSSDWATRLDLACGRLRLETLLSERVVLTDAQAFDGGIVTRLAATGRLNRIRRSPDQPLPIELRVRHPDPARALWLMYHKEDGAPTQFLPSLFAGGGNLSLAGTEQGLSGSSDAVIACARTLTAAGVPSTEIEEAIGGWGALIEACASNVLPSST